MDLTKIRVLFRVSDSMALYGIPYKMREGQSPRDLMKGSPTLPYGTYGTPGRPAGPRDDWTWLGSPGWYGTYKADEIAEIKAFLIGKDVPDHPGEWSNIE